jgi:two-component system, LytTR family, response regulator
MTPSFSPADRGESRAKPPIRALVVDDEQLSRERVRSLLERADQVEVVGECANGIEALRAIQDRKPDLLFLDVEMPELSGLALLEALGPEECPQVVFVTAHDKYLQQAFEVHALDYLRKPFTDRRFYDALQHACGRVEERLGHRNVQHGLLGLMAELRGRAGQGLDRLVIQSKDTGIFHVVRTADIDWVEAKDGGVLVHAGHDIYASRHSLTYLQERLDANAFLRIHRSFIVNRLRIRTVKPLWKGEYLVTLTSGKSLGTGRTFRATIESFLERV